MKSRRFGSPLEMEDGCLTRAPPALSPHRRLEYAAAGRTSPAAGGELERGFEMHRNLVRLWSRPGRSQAHPKSCRVGVGTFGHRWPDEDSREGSERIWSDGTLPRRGGELRRPKPCDERWERQGDQETLGLDKYSPGDF